MAKKILLAECAEVKNAREKNEKQKGAASIISPTRLFVDWGRHDKTMFILLFPQYSLNLPFFTRLDTAFAVRCLR